MKGPGEMDEAQGRRREVRWGEMHDAWRTAESSSDKGPGHLNWLIWLVVHVMGGKTRRTSLFCASVVAMVGIAPDILARHH